MFKRYVFAEGLTSLFSSNRKYLINTKGQIKDLEGNDLPYNKDIDGNKIVTCYGWDGFREYRVIDLIVVQYKFLSIPIDEYNKIVAFVIDGNPENTNASNIGYRFSSGLLEYKLRPGFYYVPGFTMLAINRDGDTISVDSNVIKSYYKTKPCKASNSKGGYYVGYCSVKNMGNLTISRHRLLCLTFKPYPDNVDSLVVNHKDGVPGNDWLDNLEFITRGQNNIHAYVNNLKQQNHPVLVKDVLTGKVTEYCSISECSRALGYAVDETIRQRILTSKYGRIFQDGTQVKLKSDARDWVIYDDPEKEIENNQERIPVSVRDCRDLSVFDYSSIRESSIATGIIDSTISMRLTNGDKRPLFGYQFKKQKDGCEFPMFTYDEYVNSLSENSFEVDSRNLLTEEYRTFTSVRKACEVFGNEIRTAFNLGRQPLLQSGWQFKLKKDQWLDSRDFDEQLYRSQKEIMGRNEITGDVVIARNAATLSKILNLDRKEVRKAALTRGNRIYDGYRFRLGVTLDPWMAL
jgi:hypothetical protein